jgi:hypothetical protein
MSAPQAKTLKSRNVSSLLSLAKFDIEPSCPDSFLRRDLPKRLPSPKRSE